MSNGMRSDSDKSPQELEREVEQQRGQIEDTLAALFDQIRPSDLFDQLLSYGRGSGGRQMMDAVRANPIPTALTPTGLAWLMFGGRSGAGRSVESGVPARESYGVDPDYDPHAGEGHVALGREDRLQHAGEAGRRRLRHGRQRAGAGFERLLDEQPLAIGVAGIALGALLGASFSESRREREMFSGARERLRETASDLAEQGASRVEEAARDTADQIDPDTTH